MIVRSHSRKSATFRQVIRYVTRHGRTAGQHLLRNLPGIDPHDLSAVGRAFSENARQLPARKNGVALYHEFLSFAPADAPRLTPAIITDLAGRYLELRAGDYPAWGAVHLDRDNPHIHLLIAANRAGREQKLRLSRGEFAAVKCELEAYQRERYPQLTRSLVCAPPSPADRAGARRPSGPGRHP